ncbi:MAG: extracellular solute-binding protein [Pseudomonadota bacterium]
MVPTGCEGNISPVIDAFREATGIEASWQAVGVGDVDSHLALDALSGEGGYDLALPATFALPDLASVGAIRDLSELAARHEPPGFRDDTLYSIGDTFDDRIYGFQADGDTYLMFYHRDWMLDPVEQARYGDLYGISLDVPQTWAELDRQMAYFHRPEQGRFGGALFRTPGYLAWEWWVRFHAKGVWPLSADLEPQIASDQGVEALEEMIRASETLYPEAKSAGLFRNWKRYSEGQIYCNIGWGGSQKYLNNQGSGMRGRMVFGPTPGGIVDGQLLRTSYFNWGWSYAVTQFSQQPELAYLFALFASTGEISTLAVRDAEGYFDPFRAEHYSDPVIQRIYSPEFLEVHEASMRASIPDLYLARQSEYFRVLNNALLDAITGREKPEAALRQVAIQWSLLNRQVGKEQQRTRWHALRGKYPDQVRRHLRDLT